MWMGWMGNGSTEAGMLNWERDWTSVCLVDGVVVSLEWVTAWFGLRWEPLCLLR